MRFKGLDLNLLLAFQILLEERSVTRAARRLNVSQPAMSAALARLRDYFGDELLVAHGKQMHPTVHAESLAEPIAQCLRDVDALLTRSASFDPASSQRRFRIVASDYITTSVICPMLERLASAAPGVRLEILLPSEEAAQLMIEGKADLVITPEDFTDPDQPTELLCEERQLLVGWQDNPAFAQGIDEAAFEALGHVAVLVGSNRVASFADRQMERLGRNRRIEITCGCFTMLPWLLHGTQRIALMHERLAHQMAARFPLAIAEIPFNFPIMREMMQFHRARVADEGLNWLRTELKWQTNT
ncbi:MAG: LysR family transcriptional regulator [Sphingobium sp.]|nr:LysR family transcriptional regulator [Sphingobium sp.]